MKKKDIALIIAVAGFSVVVALILSRLIFASSTSRSQSVQKVDAISTEFPLPDSKYFNDKSINPTQLIRIAENSNNAPFNGNGQ